MKQRSSLQKARESVRLQNSYNTITLYGMDFVLDRGAIGATLGLLAFMLVSLCGIRLVQDYGALLLSAQLYYAPCWQTRR